MPPTVLRTMDHIEKIPACHSAGMKLPTVDPTVIPIQISFLFAIDSPRLSMTYDDAGFGTRRNITC